MWGGAGAARREGTPSWRTGVGPAPMSGQRCGSCRVMRNESGMGEVEVAAGAGLQPWGPLETYQTETWCIKHQDVTTDDKYVTTKPLEVTAGSKQGQRGDATGAFLHWSPAEQVWLEKKRIIILPCLQYIWISNKTESLGILVFSQKNAQLGGKKKWSYTYKSFVAM